MTDDQVLRQRLHEEFGALEISPPPVLRVTGRGRGVRARRRALAACTVVLAALAVVAAARFGKEPTRAAVTLNAPDPAAPGGVFASGTADGKPWALAVRNIAAHGSHWCRAAVMFNGRDGDVLFKTGPSTPSFGNPALLSHIHGFPHVGAVFTQVAPGTTRLALTFPSGRQISATPVRVRACGTSFNLAGLAYDSRHVPSEIATYTRFGLGEGLNVTFAMATSVFESTTPGIWMNLDNSRADIAASQAGSPIGTGTVNGQIWHMWTSLGLYGQCYTATGRVPGHGRGQGSVCVPVTTPPRTAALTAVAVYSAQTQLPGYAGLVNPRTAYVYATISDGTTHQVVPVRVAGRTYIAFVAPPGCQLSSLSLFDTNGHPFASVVNPAQSAQPIPGLPQPAGSS
jgi:hypothetical protein